MKHRDGREQHSWDQQETFQEVMADQLKKAPWLMVSMIAHGVAIFVLWNLPWQTRTESVEQEMRVALPVKDDITEEVEPEKEEEPIQEEVVDIPPIVDTEITEDQEEILEDIPTEVVTETPFRDDQFNSIIGIGGGAGGDPKYRGRFPSRKPTWGKVKRPDGIPQALDWLARHQDEDGKWDADGFDSHCDGVKCTGHGQAIHDVGLTGLALLAFLGDGNTLRHGKYRDQVKAGIRWLKDQQDEEGLIGEKAGQAFMYSHMIATIAMCEAFGLSKSITLKRPVQKAINYISQARNPYKAWRYYPRDGDNDSSVTGWAVIALASAESFKDRGLRVSTDDFKGAISWFDEMTDPNTGRIGYIKRGTPPARPQELEERFPATKVETITAVGLLARFFAHQTPTDCPVMNAHADLLSSKPPVWNEKDGSIDMYYWYYGSYAMYQIGGARWKNWCRKMEKAVIHSQRKDGCERGSWDPVGVWGEEGGRVYSTAIMALCLQVYYRYGKLIGVGH